MLLYSSSSKVLRLDWTLSYFKGAHFIRAHGVANACLLMLAAQVSVAVLPHATSSGGPALPWGQLVALTQAELPIFSFHTFGGFFKYHHVLSSTSFPVKGVWGRSLLQSRFVTWIWLFLHPFPVISCPSLWFWGVHGEVIALFRIVHIKTLAFCIRVAIAGSLCLFLSLLSQLLSWQAKSWVILSALCCAGQFCCKSRWEIWR